jgi:hypothetical protein
VLRASFVVVFENKTIYLTKEFFFIPLGFSVTYTWYLFTHLKIFSEQVILKINYITKYINSQDAKLKMKEKIKAFSKSAFFSVFILKFYAFSVYKILFAPANYYGAGR